MTWLLMWINGSIITINATLQLLDIYTLCQTKAMRERERERERIITFFMREIENKMRRRRVKIKVIVMTQIPNYPSHSI